MSDFLPTSIETRMKKPTKQVTALHYLLDPVLRMRRMEMNAAIATGKKLPDGTNKCDSWDIERLDRHGEEGAIGDED